MLENMPVTNFSSWILLTFDVKFLSVLVLGNLYYIYSNILENSILENSINRYKFWHKTLIEKLFK